MKHLWMLIWSGWLILVCGACGSGSTAGRADAGQPDAGEGGDEQTADPRWKVTADWPTGGALDLAVDGHRLYVVNMYGLLVYDRTDPAAPTLVARYPTPGEARRLALEGGLAVVSDGRRGIAILDIADPAAAEELATVPVAGEAWGVALRDGILVAGSTHAAPRLFDLSDPASPVELGTLSGFSSVAAFSRDRVLTFGPLRSADDPPDLCTLDTRQVLRVLDVSDPATPVEIGSIQFGREGIDPACEGHAVVLPQAGWGLAVHGRYVYVVETENLVRLLDLSDPAEPLDVGRVYVPGHWVRGFTVESGRLFAHTDDGVQLFDLADPTAPELVETIAIPGGHVLQELASIGGRVVALSANAFHGLYVLDASDPHHLVRQGVVDMAHPYLARVALDSSHAYVVSWPGFMVVDLQDPEAPRIEANREELGEMRAVALQGTLAMLGAQQRIVTVDLSTPGHPELVGDLDVEQLDARHAAIEGDLGLVVSGSTSITLRTVDLSDPARPGIAGRLNLTGVAPGDPRVAVSGGTAYVACGTGGLAVIDVRDPDAPELLGTFVPRTAEFVFDVAVREDLAFVAAGSYVHVLDITDPAAPGVVDEVDTPGHATRIVTAGDHVVVGDTFDLAVLARVP